MMGFTTRFADGIERFIAIKTMPVDQGFIDDGFPDIFGIYIPAILQAFPERGDDGILMGSRAGHQPWNT